MTWKRPLLALAGALSLCALPAAAADISGTVTDTGGAALQNMEVQVWQKQDPLVSKNWLHLTDVFTDTAGVYTVTGLSDGTYKLMARMGPGVTGNWADRWYDVAPPNSSDGYAGADADEITLTFADTLNGIDIKLENFGGFNGKVLVGGTATPMILIRAERDGDPRIHHNDETQIAPHLGEFYMRGMVPATDYRFMAHDREAIYDIAMVEPLTCSTGVNLTIPNLVLSPMPVDPNGANDDSTAVDLDLSTTLHASPPLPFVALDPNISPRNTGDTDWYCFQALDGDRLILTAQATLTVASGTREDPWMDPILAVFDGTGTTKLFEDDDSAPDSRGAMIDTGVLAAGRYCAAVSTYGDINYTGTIQGSAGRYGFTIEMGNRRPVLTASVGGSPAPVPPAAITIDEAQSVTIDLAYSDIDGDPLTPTAVMTDNAGNPVATGVFTPGSNSATFAWTADQVAAQAGPYTVRFTVADAEFTEVVTVGIEVNAVNLTPSVPVQVAPADGTTVMVDIPDLVVDNATDGDNDALTYEYELYYGASATPDQTGSVTEDAGGQTTWTPDPIPENTHARWRVRAFDGQTDSPYSMWTGEWSFFVDTQNDPPEAPTFVKPDDSETLNIRKPTLSATNPTDPEGDTIVMRFQLAKNAGFTEGLIESPDIPLNTAGNSTMWNLVNDLPWGSTWFARAYARDDRGGVSPMSNYHVFQVRSNVAPSPPVLGAPFDATCQNLDLKAAKLESVTVGVSTDPEMEPVSIQLRVIPGEGDPNTVAALFDQSQEQTADETKFNTSGVELEEDTRYRVQARAYDGTDYSEWSQCDFTVNAVENPGGNGPGKDGDDPKVKEGCGCGATDASALSLFGALALVAAGMRRRRKA